MTDALLSGLLAGYGVAIPVGAIGVLIMGLAARTSLSVGAGAGLGVATADGLYALLAVAGGAAVAGLIRPIATPLRWTALVVLVGLAVRTAWSAWRTHRDAVGAVPGRSRSRLLVRRARAQAAVSGRSRSRLLVRRVRAQAAVSGRSRSRLLVRRARAQAAVSGRSRSRLLVRRARAQAAVPGRSRAVAPHGEHSHGQRPGRLALSSPGRAYAGLLGLTLLNPTTIVYFSALVLGRQAGAGRSLPAGALFVAAAFAASASWQLLVAAGGSMLGRVLSGERGRLATALVSSAVMVVLAVRLALIA